MKKIIFLIICTLFFLGKSYMYKVTEGEKIKFNQNYSIFKNNFLGGIWGQVVRTEVVFFCVPYILIKMEENIKYKTEIDYCGQIKKLNKINGYWIGKNITYDEIERGYSLYKRLYTLDTSIEEIEKLKNIINNHSGYFIIGENVEKFNLTYKELQVFFGRNWIVLYDAEKYVSKYGEGKQLTPYYYKKSIDLNDEENFEKYEKMRLRKIWKWLILLLIEILIFMKILKERK